MAVDAIDDMGDRFDVMPLMVDRVEKTEAAFTIQPGMVEFAEVLSVIAQSAGFFTDRDLINVLDKLNRAIEQDPSKGIYHALRFTLLSFLDRDDEALADITAAINIAEQTPTEWILAPQAFEVTLEPIEMLPSGHPEFPQAYQIELDKGEFYMMRYEFYWDLDLENEPCALDDLRMAARLGNEEALEELAERGLFL